MECITSFYLALLTINEMSGSKRKNYELLSSKLLFVFFNSRNRSWKTIWNKSNIIKDRLGLQSDTFVLSCSIADSSTQDRLGAIFSAMWVEMSILLSTQLLV